jgi:NADH dehydrogenase [ubiquinone] 1 alpha subcomplex assembly factor 7
MTLETLIKDRIRNSGPMTVAEYMALALTHPDYGYYMRADPLGVSGDFITAPEISQVFGELIGAWLATQWIIMGKPQTVLAELGPGRGTLMNDCLRATKNIAGFHNATSIHMVETSPVLAAKQQQTLAGKHPDIHWHERFETIPPKPLLLVANEFFDALPVRQFVNGQERMVEIKDDTLRFSATGEIIETCETALEIMSSIASHIAAHDGAALIVDYGYVGGSRGDTLQAVRKHEYCDVLFEPGSADLTAHVDFKSLKEAAEKAGASAYGPIPQGAFLAALGAAMRVAHLSQSATTEQKSAMISGLKRLVSPDQMGDLFKVLCVTHPDHPKPEGFP